MPAQCATARQPANAAANSSTSASRAFTRSASFARACRASRTTSWPSLVNRSARWLPTNPAAPVIATLMDLLLVNQVVMNFVVEKADEFVSGTPTREEENQPQIEITKHEVLQYAKFLLVSHQVHHDGNVDDRGE